MDDQSYGADIFLAEPLTQRELEILRLLADDLSNREIADRLTIALSTVKWYARQIYGKLGVSNRRQAVERARNLGLLQEDDLPKFYLPSQTLPFFGRESELEEIDRLLTDPECRLLTLTGLGGVGKTRLAIKAAGKLSKDRGNLFHDGVYFVSLAPLDDASSIVPTIAEALKFSFYEGKIGAKQQLIDYLRHKRTLLVLDNFEYLVGDDSTSLIMDILFASSWVKFLVTSRSRLNVLGEQLLPVTGLRLPEIGHDQVEPLDLQRALSYSSLQLFQGTACRVRPEFSITPVDLPSIIGICRAVDGNPLGIELAASWVEMMAPQEILAEIKSSLDFLEADLYDLPERQRSLRVVFDSSWKLLNKDEREAVQTLSVFQGGFTHQAAQEVGGISLKTLLRLFNKSWVGREPTGRFQFHELLRAYANQVLGESPTEWQLINEKHATHYCVFLKERET
ncbi:MAG: AAA family ATPase, partial [Anaerolineales bacterium]|nr:AAA family ATPase [Anaerolineales bacterium]